jgi:hypothetical protein
VGEPPCGAEPRIELGPAFQQADALPTVPRRTIHHINLWFMVDSSSFLKKIFLILQILFYISSVHHHTVKKLVGK